VLGMGGLRNLRARNRWLRVLRWLGRIDSPMRGVSGDQAIVESILNNFVSGTPEPVYFTSHDGPTDPPRYGSSIRRGRSTTVSVVWRPPTDRVPAMGDCLCWSEN